jgi:hypothetical protein
MAIACSKYCPSRKVHFPLFASPNTEHTLRPILWDERRCSKKKGENFENRGVNITPGQYFWSHNRKITITLKT